MSFMVHGSQSPVTYERSNMPGSARRPNSGRPLSSRPTSSRNPITGEVRQTAQPQSRPVSRPQGVPSLNLKCFTQETELARPVVLEDYALDTAKSAATNVSWGTPCGSARSERHRNSHRQAADVKGTSGRSSRPKDVPELHLGCDEDDKIYMRKAKTPKHKEPSAWDNVPVPDGLPTPSAKHQQLYKQYQDEMKASYKAKGQVTQEDVDREIALLKKARTPVTYGDVRKEVEREQYGSSEDEEDIIDQKWAAKKSYSTTQMLKKMDAEELLDYNKKQKVIETVLADQLSRAVISDPGQNSRGQMKTQDARRGTGSHRYLHDSKVRTKTTATENLLSKRVRFGARVLTRDGHDAMRELTGFFFSADNSLTIYEFRQFGKSAKALPFIVRGRYCHLQGARKGEPYTLTDIVQGLTLMIPSEGQHSLPATLKKQERIVFCITDVDEEEKQALLLEDIRPSARYDAYAEMHVKNKQEFQDRVFLAKIQEEVRKKLKKRGVKTVTGLARHYRKTDTGGRGVLYRYELEQGLFKFHIDLPPEQLDAVFEILDVDGTGMLDYTVYIHGVIGDMNEYRKSLVRRAFRKIDSGKRGKTSVSDIRKFFNSSFRPHLNPAISEDTTLSALQAFINAVQTSNVEDDVSYAEFEEYYEGLSISIEDDEDFANIIRNTWNI